MKTLWCKNQENPSDRISHAWANAQLTQTSLSLYVSSLYRVLTPPPPPLGAAKTGRNNLKQVKYPLLPTGISEQYSQTVPLTSACSTCQREKV
jgi:hypothetical protein